MWTSRIATNRTSSCNRVLALVLASGRGLALEGLTASQPKAAVPFGGQHRIVDFVLSNCVNSDIRRIALLTQYKSQTLIRHVHSGWGFLHRELGEFLEVWPAQQQDGERWYRGTVDAVFQNLDLIEESGAQYVLLLADDEVYTLDYARLLDAHVAGSADVTIACARVPAADGDGRRTNGGWIDQIERWTADATTDPAMRIAPMGACVVSAELLAVQLRAGSVPPAADVLRDWLPSLARSSRALAYVHGDEREPRYWRTIDTIDRYWRAHMELLDQTSPSVFADADWPVFTRHEPLPPARILHDAYVDSAIVSPGAVVGGDVTHSVISARCRIGPDSVVKHCVLLPGAVVGAGCRLERVVVDAGCEIAAGTRLGPRFVDDSRYHASAEGIVLASTGRTPAGAAGARKIA